MFKQRLVLTLLQLITVEKCFYISGFSLNSAKHKINKSFLVQREMV